MSSLPKQSVDGDADGGDSDSRRAREEGESTGRPTSRGCSSGGSWRRRRARSSSATSDDSMETENLSEERQQKQQRQNLPPRPLITVAEFTSIMNGSDDPYTMIRVLKEFTKTIRKERRFALSTTLSASNHRDDEQYEDESDDDHHDDRNDNQRDQHQKHDRRCPNDIDGGSDDDDDPDAQAESSPPPKKKYKEEWMKDTESYNVPFVGTAVARGEFASVVKGQWPTGLLLAYTTKSPNAIELLGQQDNLMYPTGNIHRRLIKKKSGNTSRSLAKAHLFAIAELLNVKNVKEGEVPTAASSSSSLQPILVQCFVKNVLPWIYDLINDETGKGRGKTGVTGGCGSLVEPCLVVLRRFASMSLQHGRMVARQLDEKLLDGVLRFCLRPLSSNTSSSGSKNVPMKNEPMTNRDDAVVTGKQSNHQQDDDPKSSYNMASKQSRTEAIRLAACLLKFKDGYINTTISISGNRERKIKSGILYMSLREGMSSVLVSSQPPSQSNKDEQHQRKHDPSHDQYLRSIGELIRSIRVFLFDGVSSDTQGAVVVGGNNGGNHPNVSYNTRVIHDLLSRDPLTHLCRLSMYAPRLSSDRPCIDVLDVDDIADNEPFTAIQNVGIEARRLLFPLISRPMMSPLLLFRPDYDQLARVIVKILNSPSSTLEEQKFIVHCAIETPGLVPDILKLLVLPDAKQTYKYISMTRFVTSLLRSGPSPLSCIETRLVNKDDKWNPDIILSVVVPLKFMGNPLVKALHSANALTRIETLKMIIVFLERLEILLNSGAPSIDVAVVSVAMEKALPGLQTLLSLRNVVGQKCVNKPAALQSVFLFRAIEVYIRVLPLVIKDMKFDWTKIIPDDVKEFHCIAPAMQVIVLRCFKSIVISEWVDAKTLLLSSRSLFEVMTSTRKKRVYKLCRDIALQMLHHALLPQNASSDVSAFIEFESAVWVDSLQSNLIGPFFQFLFDGLLNSLEYVTAFGDTMLKHQFPICLNFSLVLMAALQYTGKVDNNDVSSMVEYVAIQCLLHLKDPVPLAACIASQGGTKNSEAFNEYATALLDLGSGKNKSISKKVSGFHRLQLLENLLKSGCPHHKTHIKALQYLEGSNAVNSEEFVPRDAVDGGYFIKFLRHVAIISDAISDASIKKRYGDIIRQVLPVLILETGEKNFSLLDDVYGAEGLFDDFDFDGINLVVFSSLRHAKSSRIVDDILADQIHAMGKLERTNEKKALLLLSMAEDRLQNVEKTKIALHLLQPVEQAANNERYQHFAANFLSWKSAERESYQGLDNDIQAVVEAWTWAANKAKGGPPHSVHRHLKVSLSRILSDVLCSREYVASTALRALEIKPTSLIVRLALDLSVGDKVWVRAEVNFLESLMMYKFDEMIDEILDFLSVLSGNLKQVWQDGLLDHFLSRILLCSKIQKNSGILPSVVNAIFSLTSKRICISLESEEAILSDHLVVDTVCHLLSSGVRFTDMQHLTEKVISSCMTTSNQCLASFGASKITVHLIKYLDETDRTCSDSVMSKVQTRLLVRLLALVRQSLKSRKNTTLSGQQKTLVLRWTMSLLAKPERFERGSPDGISSDEVVETIKFCLKRGIASTDGDNGNELEILAIQLVHSLIQFSKQARSFTLSIPPLSQVFEMTTTHSQFSVVLAKSGEGDEHAMAVAEEVLKLLNLCFETVDHSIQIHPDIWRTIFLAFRAGMSSTDTLVRKLIATVPDSHHLYTDEIFWHGVAPRNRSSDVGDWDWLVDCIDISRVRATIQDFPICDSIMIAELDPHIDDNDDSRSSVESKQKYSPGFLLPLLLAFLESAPVGIPSLRSLIDRGIIALCLSSLCSNCVSIRMYAVAVLGCILHACQTMDARETTSWRDRPQIVMILNAVQRFLVFHRLHERERGGHVIAPPKLVPIVANFLARASLAVAKPDDGLYVAINRFFLKTEANHGAFQDWNRLPGFISLFCASSEDPEEARVERLWALHLLRDGMLDEESYQIVLKSHAPELVLTSFENVYASKFSPGQKEVEYVLLFESMRSMLRRGGSSASNHLIGRLGLLSWTRSWCDSKPMAEAFQSIRTRIAFCRLLRAAIKASSETPRLLTSSLVHEACGIIQPLVSLLLLPTSFASSSSEESEATVTQECLSVLRDIKNLLMLLNENDELRCRDVQSLGCSVESAREVLTLLMDSDANHDETTTRDFLNCICQLPVSIWKYSPSSLHHADDFVDLTLRFLANFGVGEDTFFDEIPVGSVAEWIPPIIKRVLLVASTFHVTDGNHSATARHPDRHHRSQETKSRLYLRSILIKYPYLSSKEGREMWLELHDYLVGPIDALSSKI